MRKWNATIRLLLAASLAASALLLFTQVELRLPKLAPAPPTLLAPVLASARSL